MQNFLAELQYQLATNPTIENIWHFVIDYLQGNY